MKVSILNSFSLLLLMSTTLYAALEHDLQSLQQHLTALENALTGKAPAGGVPKKTWKELAEELVEDFKVYNMTNINALIDTQGNVNKNLDKTFADIFRKMAIDLNNLNTEKAPNQKSAVAISRILNENAEGITFFLNFVKTNVDIGMFKSIESEEEAEKVRKLFIKSAKLWWENAKQNDVQPPAGGEVGLKREIGNAEKYMEEFTKIMNESIWKALQGFQNALQKNLTSEVVKNYGTLYKAIIGEFGVFSTTPFYDNLKNLSNHINPIVGEFDKGDATVKGYITDKLYVVYKSFSNLVKYVNELAQKQFMQNSFTYNDETKTANEWLQDIVEGPAWKEVVNIANTLKPIGQYKVTMG